MRYAPTSKPRAVHGPTACYEQDALQRQGEKGQVHHE